jgi:hypothetical protein
VDSCAVLPPSTQAPKLVDWIDWLLDSGLNNHISKLTRGGRSGQQTGFPTGVVSVLA